jgi:ABC-2 type transport system permease protein
LRSFRAVFFGRYKQFVRNRGAVFFSFVFPIIFILLFGWALGNINTETFKVGIADEGSPRTASYITQGLRSVLIRSNHKEFKIRSGKEGSLLESVKKGNLDAVIVIPPGMDALGSDQSSDIHVYYDSSRTQNQQTLIPTLNQVVSTVDQRLGGYTPRIGVQETSTQSHALRYIDFLLPGILGMTLMFIGIQGGLPIIQQRQAHIIKRLGSTPLRRPMLVLGDLAVRLIVSLVSAAIIILVGRLVFNVHMLGSWVSLFGMVLLGSLVFVNLGYLVAAFVRSQESAIPVINIIQLPMMILSGTFFSVGNMPVFVEPLVKVLPLTFLNDALRQIMESGSPLHPMSLDIGVLVAWAIAILVVTTRFFRWD